MTKGTFVVQVKCVKCGSTVVDVPDGYTDNTIVHCGNGHVLGPYGALQAAIKNQSHTVIFGAITEATFKPIK